MSSFFVSPEQIKGNIALIDGDEAHHILDVMRLKAGDRITAFDGSGKRYGGKILEARPKTVKLQIESVQRSSSRLNLQVTLVQALPNAKKMDYIIEKCTELDVHSIIPVEAARTVVKLDKKARLLRQGRWQRIAREAAKQCGRATIPEIKDIIPLREAFSASSDNFSLKLLAYLGENPQSLKDVLRLGNRAEKVIVFVGPEGDFTPEEIRQADSFGCTPISLGANVLKSDTAAISVLAMINYALRQ